MNRRRPQQWQAPNPSKRRVLQIGAAIAGVLVAGGIIGVLLRSNESKAAKRSGGKKRSCPVLSSAGGTLDGVTYEEIMTGGADPDAAVPMVIAFHGRGAAPEFMAPIVKDLRAPARIIIPQGIDTLGKYFAWWDTKSTGDQADLTAGMVRAAGRLAPFVEAIRDCRPTIGKPILAGHSQGGMLVLALAATKPESMDAAIAGSAWLPSGLWREGMAPVHLLHGSADTTVPYPRTRDMVEKLEALGNNWDLETIEGHGHGLSGSLKTRWLDRIDDAVAAQAQ